MATTFRYLATTFRYLRNRSTAEGNKRASRPWSVLRGTGTLGQQPQEQR